MTHAADFAFEQEIGLFLATCRTASLATVDGDGAPHAANVQFAHDERLRLIWVSSPDAGHSQHLRREPRAAVTCYAHDDRVHNIHGVQLHGTVDTIDATADWNAAWELYTAKFAFVAAMPQYREMVQQQRFYRLTPTWARWIDNRRGFGFKVERDLR